MNITHIVFDLDETLLDYAKAQKTALQATVTRFGIPYSEPLRRVFSEYNDALWRMHEKGEITQQRLTVHRFELLLQHFDYPEISADALQEEYVGQLSEAAFLLPQAKEVCEELSKRFSLAVATNGIPRVQRRRLRKSGLEGCFDHIFISQEIGKTKPDPDFFRIVLKELETTAEHVLMVGDSLHTDIAGGQSVGIYTCWVHDFLSNNDTIILPNFEIASVSELLALSALKK